MNKDFGNRLWGFSWGLWLLIWSNSDFYSGGAIIMCASILVYFSVFGADRFDGKYKRIL